MSDRADKPAKWKKIYLRLQHSFESLTRLKSG